MVPRVTATTYGDEIVSRKLNRLADYAGDLRPAWPAVREVAAAGFENAFANEGPGWAPLSKDTEFRRIKEGYPRGPILTKSGAYRQSMTIALRYRGTADTITFISGIEYGKYHQFGTSRMPMRKLELTKYFQRQMSEVIAQRLSDAYNVG
jgi:phage gpG-like protein